MSHQTPHTIYSHPEAHAETAVAELEKAHSQPLEDTVISTIPGLAFYLVARVIANPQALRAELLSYASEQPLETLFITTGMTMLLLAAMYLVFERCEYIAEYQEEMAYQLRENARRLLDSQDVEESLKTTIQMELDDAVEWNGTERSLASAAELARLWGIATTLAVLISSGVLASQGELQNQTEVLFILQEALVPAMVWIISSLVIKSIYGRYQQRIAKVFLQMSEESLKKQKKNPDRDEEYDGEWAESERDTTSEYSVQQRF